MKISTKQILIGIALLQALLYGFSAYTISETHESQTPAKPNILFIFADDLRADALGYAGNRIIQTPNIDQLAASGTYFKNCCVMGGHHGAICAPSRAMLMSGKSLFHVYDQLDGVHTMPQHFAEVAMKPSGQASGTTARRLSKLLFKRAKR